MEPTTSFADRRGRRWDLALDIGLARRVRKATGVDFGKVGDGKLFIELSQDWERLAQVLWIICEAAAETSSVTPEAFVAELDGDALDRSVEALIEAIILFTPASMRGPLRKVIETTQNAQQKSLIALESWVSSQSDDLERQAIQRTNEALAKLGASSPS